MKSIEWEDETNYAWGERGHKPPRILRTRIDKNRITINRHTDYPDTWLLNVRGGYLIIDKYDLNTNDFDKAEEKAKEYILNVIYKINKIRDYILELE